MIVGGSLALYLNWPEPGMRGPASLSSSITKTIATLAINYHQSASIELASDNAAKVLAGMTAHQLPFTPELLKPRTEMTLQGEGVLDFQGQPAVFTRWTSPQGKFTVYQFDGKPLGMPNDFAQAEYTPSSKTVHVHIWPGTAGCDWVVVADAEVSDNPFYETY